MPATVKTALVEEGTVKVDPRKEYLAGGDFYTYGGGLRTLASSEDEVTKYHSIRAYEQMVTDPKVSKTLNILKISTLGDGVELMPAVPETAENYDDALAISVFCDKALRGLETPLRYTLEQLMDALIYGHKIAEITYKTTTVDGFNGTFLVPDKIKVKAHGVVKFVMDDKKNVVGLTAKALAGTKNTNPEAPLQKGYKIIKGKGGEPLVNGQPILPRSKFMVLTFRGKDNDPRGSSILMPAFQMWHLKTSIWQEYLHFLLLCSIPLLVGFTPEETLVKEILRNPDGTPARDPDTGLYREVNPVEALRDAMLHARNAEVLAVKGGTKIEEIGAQGAGTPFFKAIELFDSQIESAILLQTLATSEGIHQSRAASIMHMSVLDQLVWWLKGIVVDMLVADLLRQIVRFNFGDDALELTPKATLGDTERREFATDAVPVADLYKAGYLQPEQLKRLDAMLGLPIRETVDPLQSIQQLQAAGVKITAVPPPPDLAAEVQAGPGGGSKGVPVSSAATLPTTGRGGIKFPASGRVKAKINKSPRNAGFPDKVNVKP